jgi:hypothetical protein
VETYAYICAWIAVGIAGVLLVTMAIDPVERYRKWKHKKWYELFNEAKCKSFDNSKFMAATLGAIEYQHTVLLNMARAGRIEDKQVNDLIKNLTEAFKIFKTEYDRRYEEVECLLHEAHDYAVKNNLKWGLLYEDQRE